MKLNFLGFTNLDKISTYLKSDKIQYTHQPVKNRPRPKGRHTIIAVRYNERNNRTCFALSNAICKRTAVMTPDLFSIFLFIIQSGTSSKNMNICHLPFIRVTRDFRSEGGCDFLTFQPTGVAFNRLLRPEIWFWHQITVAHVKTYNSAIICDLNCSSPTIFDVIMGRKVSKTVK